MKLSKNMYQSLQNDHECHRPSNVLVSGVLQLRYWDKLFTLFLAILVVLIFLRAHRHFKRINQERYDFSLIYRQIKNL